MSGTYTYTYSETADYVLTQDFDDTVIGPIEIEPGLFGTNPCTSRVITAFEVGFYVDTPSRRKIEIEMTKENGLN